MTHKSYEIVHYMYHIPYVYWQIQTHIFHMIYIDQCVAWLVKAMELTFIITKGMMAGFQECDGISHSWGFGAVVGVGEGMGETSSAAPEWENRQYLT